MTRRTIVTITAAVLVIVGGATVGVLLLTHKPSDAGSPRSRPATVATRSPGGVPVGAEAMVRLLLSAHGREALTPELNSALGHRSERLFPAGSTFTPSAGSWHQAGAYANLTGTLREPGKAPSEAEIGFVSLRGRWLITFEGTP